LPERAIFTVLEQYSVFDHHFNAYVFFATYGIAIGHVIASLFVGCMVALVARSKEMVATIALVLAFLTMMAAALPVLIVTGRTPILSMLAWNFADWLAIMIGGAIVRMRRSATTSGPSHA
jgi:predicted membrane-bound dolichyl-phosphate-mannose-protein mannosyltransferase